MKKYYYSQMVLCFFENINKEFRLSMFSKGLICSINFLNLFAKHFVKIDHNKIVPSFTIKNRSYIFFTLSSSCMVNLTYEFRYKVRSSDYFELYLVKLTQECRYKVRSSDYFELYQVKLTYECRYKI